MVTMASRFIVAAVLGLATGVLAVPMPSARADPASLSVSAVSTLLNPWGYYAAAGYCAPEATLTWTCGGALRFFLFVDTSIFIGV